MLVWSEVCLTWGLYEMEACRVEEEKPEWRTVGTMAEGRSFLGSAAVGGKVTLTGRPFVTCETSIFWNPQEILLK